MANLTSKEWRDLIFQDKNKEFGAYTMRKNSEKRHTLAVIFTLIGLAVIIIAVIWYSNLSAKWAAEREEQLRLEREKMRQLELEQEQQEEEVPEDEDIVIPLLEEIPEIEIPKEELVASVQQTQVAIVDEVKNEIQAVVEQQEDDRARGTETVDGNADVDDGIVKLEQAVVVDEPVVPEPEPVKAPPPKPVDEEIFKVVEQAPLFPGGESELMSWLGKNLNYPIRAQENGISGRVIVGFVVEKDGSISNVQVVKGVDKDLDAEAIRVVKKMPKWQPGKNNGHAVRSFFNLPVKFELR